MQSSVLCSCCLDHKLPVYWHSRYKAMLCDPCHNHHKDLERLAMFMMDARHEADAEDEDVWARWVNMC